MVYVDLFPVKLTVGGVKKLEFPEPDGDDLLSKEARRLGLFRHYSKRGILFVLFLDLCRQRPELRKEFRWTIMIFCRDKLSNSPSAMGLFRSSPGTGVNRRSGAQKDEKIILHQSGRGISYFFLRSLACQLACLTEDHDALAKFFHMTHFQSQAMTDKAIEEAKEFLLNWAKKL